MNAGALTFHNRQALEANLSQLKTEFLINGVEAIDPAMFSIERFAKMSAEEQDMILSNISAYLQILSQDITPRRERRDYEIERLKCALAAFKLKLKDGDFFNKIGEQDYIEFYNHRNIQIYRSVKFFSLCSYSLLDLSVNPWDELYDKPVGVMNHLLGEIGKSMMEQTTVASSLGSFVQREKFTYANATALRTFLVNFRFVTPLISEETSDPAGFLCTFTSDVLGEGSNKFSVL